LAGWEASKRLPGRIGRHILKQESQQGYLFLDPVGMADPYAGRYRSVKSQRTYYDTYEESGCQSGFKKTPEMKKPTKPLRIQSVFPFSDD
jgi:hypothetical protein